MRSYREDCNHAKAARRGEIEQRPVGRRAKREKPVIVEARHPNGPFKSWRTWRKWKAYGTVAEAETARDNLARKYASMEFRLRPEAD